MLGFFAGDVVEVEQGVGDGSGAELSAQDTGVGGVGDEVVFVVVECVEVGYVFGFVLVVGDVFEL